MPAPRSHACTLISSRRTLSLAFVGALSIPLAGCSSVSSSRFQGSGPSWSLAGASSGLSQPKPFANPAPQQVAAAGGTPNYVYKGGRDPSTGRAPSTLLGEPQPARALAAAQAPGMLPPQPVQVAAQRPEQGVQAVASYHMQAPPDGPGVPYTAAPEPAVKLQTVRKGETLTVADGDSITAIASRHKVALSEIMRVNKLKSLVLSPGQQIIIPQR